jgi:hypothetical protein
MSSDAGFQSGFDPETLRLQSDYTESSPVNLDLTPEYHPYYIMAFSLKNIFKYISALRRVKRIG